MIVGARQFQPSTSVRSGAAGFGEGLRIAVSSTSAAAVSARRIVSSSALMTMTSSPAAMSVSIGGFSRGTLPAAWRPMSVESSNAPSASPNVRPTRPGTEAK
jgi:hypothetical protein